MTQNYVGSASYFGPRKKKKEKVVKPNAFEFVPQAMKDVILIKPNHKFIDERGWFMENYKKSEFHEAGITEEFVQENISFSQAFVLRGAHYQRDPKAQGKLVSVSQGYIWDFFVDIREDSETYGHWGAVKLSHESGEQLYIPSGFAHGFLALKYAKVHYKCTNEYSPEHDAGFIYNDKEVNIQFPNVNNGNFTVSKKDLALPSFEDRDHIWVS